MLTIKAKRAFGIVSGCVTATLLFACNRQRGADPQVQIPSAVPVKVQIAQNVPVSDSSEYVATLKSRDSAVIMPQVEGWVTDIYVHSGEQVAAGTRLMQIDPAKQEATVRSQQNVRAAQEADLTYAREQYKRSSELYSAGVVSKQDLDRSKSALDAAEAQLQALDAQLREQQVQLHYYTVNSPRTGIIGDIPIRVGDRVTTTTALTTVDKPGSLEAYIYVPVERSSQMRRKMLAQIVDEQDHVIADSHVSFVSPRVDDTTQTVLIKSAVTNKGDLLRTSQFIRARLTWETHLVPVIPVLAVSRIGGQYFAFVAEASGNGFVARQKALRIGRMIGNDYAVVDGLKPGDLMIVSGIQFLVDGAPVAPQR